MPKRLGAGVRLFCVFAFGRLSHFVLSISLVFSVCFYFCSQMFRHVAEGGNINDINGDDDEPEMVFEESDDEDDDDAPELADE